MTRSLGTLLLILLLASPAWALPPPKTPAELLLASDLVVDARCVSVVCVGKPYDDGKKVITTYRSTFYPTKSYKGGLPKSLTVVGEKWQYKSSPPVGGWHQEPVPSGWIGKMYLKKAAAGYTKVWWNALVEDKTSSNPLALPACAATDAGPPPLDAGPKPDTMASPDAGPKPDTGTPPDLMPAKEGGILHDNYLADQPPKVDSGNGNPDLGNAGGDDGGCAVAPAPAPTWTFLLLLGLLILRRRA